MSFLVGITFSWAAKIIYFQLTAVVKTTCHYERILNFATTQCTPCLRLELDNNWISQGKGIGLELFGKKGS